MPEGAFVLWTLDRDGNLINYNPPPVRGDPAQQHPELAQVGPAPERLQRSQADPSDPDAVDIYFGVPARTEPIPKDQLDLQGNIQKVLRTIQVLYLVANPSAERRQRQFRNYYVRLFRLGQLGLEGGNVSTDLAAAALSATTADLIDDEAGNVKSKHLRALGDSAARIGLPCIGLYLLLRLISEYCPAARQFLIHLAVDPALVANFMLLLAGSSLGVWLSYAIRTTSFTLSDLTITDADRLPPAIRLVFAGSLTLILGILFAIPLLELRVGNVAMTDVATYPMLAFAVGCFCGIAELTLPTAVAKRASDFIQNIK